MNFAVEPPLPGQPHSAASSLPLAAAALVTEHSWDQDRQQAAERIPGCQEQEDIETAIGFGETLNAAAI